MSIQNAAQEITITVDEKHYQGWVSQVSKSSWQATCTVEGRFLQGTGASKTAALDSLRWQANNHDS